MWASILEASANRRQNRQNRQSSSQNGRSRITVPTIQITSRTRTTTSRTGAVTSSSSSSSWSSSAVVASASSSSDSHRQLSLLFNLCRRWAWTAIEFRCQSHPQEATSRDAKGDTCMHWVAFGKPPVSVVTKLLETNPPLASIPNNDGLLPLHVAVSYRASEDVLRVLVEAYPESVHESMGILHTACDVGCSMEGLRVLATPRSVLQRDATFHQTPLQLLNARKNMRHFHATVKMIRHLRSEQFELRRECNIHIAKRNAAATAAAAAAADKGENVDNGDDDDDGDDTTTKMMKAELERFETQIRVIEDGWDFWHKATILIQTEYQQRSLQAGENPTIRIVHACAGLETCPSSLLDLALILYPKQLTEQDHLGQVPLHKAAVVGAVGGTAVGADNLKYVLLACPKAAFVRDQEGKYPLNRAIEAGRPWKCGINLLVKANPSILESLDLDERLYPSLWSQLSRMRLDTLFESIRSKPALFEMH